MTTESGLVGLIDEQYGVTVTAHEDRFLTGAWRFQSVPPVVCGDCGGDLRVYRRGFQRYGQSYEYWGIVCLSCLDVAGIDDFDAETGRLLRAWDLLGRDEPHAARRERADQDVQLAGVPVSTTEVESSAGGGRESEGTAIIAVPAEVAEQVPNLIETGLRELRDKRAAAVLADRLGLSPNPPRTLEEIGHELGVSRERVRQLETKAARRLQRVVVARGLSFSEALRALIRFEEDGWEERLAHLASALLPAASQGTAQKTLMLMVPNRRQKRAAPLAVQPGSTRSPDGGRLEEAPVVSREAAIVSASEGSSLVASRRSASEAVFHLFGVEVTGGPRRFESPGWFHVGQTVAECPTCGVVLEGFRAPYTTKAGLKYNYWALACLKCRTLWAPEDLGD